MEDFRDVRGQCHAKRAIEVAWQGHNMLMIGPWIGKTMLAKRIPSILPPIEFRRRTGNNADSLRDGLLPSEPASSIHAVPLTASHIRRGSLEEAASPARRSEHGAQRVLFLDECRSSRNVLEVMRQPLEERRHHCASSNDADLPASFILVAPPTLVRADLNDFGANALYAPQIQRYMSKNSGPLMDRIDSDRCARGSLQGTFQHTRCRIFGNDSHTLIAARSVQFRRFYDEKIYTNAQWTAHIRKFCVLTPNAKRSWRTP